MVPRADAETWNSTVNELHGVAVQISVTVPCGSVRLHANNREFAWHFTCVFYPRPCARLTIGCRTPHSVDSRSSRQCQQTRQAPANSTRQTSGNASSKVWTDNRSRREPAPGRCASTASATNPRRGGFSCSSMAIRNTRSRCGRHAFRPRMTCCVDFPGGFQTPRSETKPLRWPSGLRHQHPNLQQLVPRVTSRRLRHSSCRQEAALRTISSTFRYLTGAPFRVAGLNRQVRVASSNAVS